MTVNMMIGSGIGLALGAVTMFGGVASYQGDPAGVAPNNLYTYADN